MKATISMLLIVPYGIETYINRGHMSTRFLLIVPYGIETEEIELTYAGEMTF